MNSCRYRLDVDSARVFACGSLKRSLSLRRRSRRRQRIHHFCSLAVLSTCGVLVLLLHTPCCCALQKSFRIERATTPERIEEIYHLLGEQNNERRQALGASDSDGPVVRFAALDHGVYGDDDDDNDAAIVGCVFCQIRRPDPAPSVAHFLTPYIHLYNLQVSPRMRRRGIGTALVARVIEECNIADSSKEDGCKGILLSVDAVHASNAVRMYEKLGFSVSGVKYEGETPMFRPKDSLMQ